VDSLKIELEKNKYNSPTKISYRQKIIKKEYFKRYINYRGKGKILGYKYLFLKFLRTFQPLLPELPLEENLSDVMKAVSKSDFSKIYDSASREFSNKGSTVGHNYLKHHFKSYWKSRFKKNPSPYDAWLDDKIMSDVIAYRIGVNDSDEIFDFSLQQMITGMSARRLTVSFFKPVLAAAIYKHYLGNHPNPIVLDPCCGFGGRLIGFKSIYPTGTYIGCEPNVETYAELIGMIDREGLTNVKIHNCKFEDYTGPFDVDLTFTSIPYHDLEIYSNHVDYKDFDLWRNKFIGSIEKRCKNCYINLNEECADKIGWRNIDNYILSNPTHFSKITSVRREVIVKV
jgi:hypothetical protein